MRAAPRCTDSSAKGVDEFLPAMRVKTRSPPCESLSGCDQTCAATGTAGATGTPSPYSPVFSSLTAVRRRRLPVHDHFGAIAPEEARRDLCVRTGQEAANRIRLLSAGRQEGNRSGGSQHWDGERDPVRWRLWGAVHRDADAAGIDGGVPGEERGGMAVGSEALQSEVENRDPVLL